MDKKPNRFDNRTKEQFAQQVLFGTKVEKLMFDLFLESCSGRSNIEITNVKDNGVANDGSFVEHGVNTSGADYKVDIKYDGYVQNDMPLEVKWVPTYGKLTLKSADLQAYQRENAGILFIFTSKGLNLKRPEDLDFDAYRERVLKNKDSLCWGLMIPDEVYYLTTWASRKAVPIPYMGGKLGIVIEQKDFTDWFEVEKI